MKNRVNDDWSKYSLLLLFNKYSYLEVDFKLLAFLFDKSDLKFAYQQL